MEALLTALPSALSVESIISVLAGSFIGLVFGSIPGLTFTVALALVLPMSFSLDPTPAIGLLLGTYIGGMTGGSVSAILLGIPGTPSAAATVIDGYQLTKRGKASLALGTAVIVSVFGGLLSLLVMILSVDFVARMAIKFGPAEIFALVVFGLSTICGLSGESMLRGLIAGCIGLMAMTIGLDELEGAQRLTFGFTTMQQGVNLLVAMIGLFAVPHIIRVIVDYLRGEQVTVSAADVRTELPSLRDLRKNFWLMLRCGVLGTGIGAIPGTGGPIAAFLAYDHAKRFSKTPERFGKGSIEGVVAPETANNAVTGGAMIPLLSLGIPGDPATAIVLSGLLIHGLIPGPMLFIEHPVQIYSVYIAIIIAYLAVLVIQVFGIRIFVRVLQVPAHMLAVGIIVMCGLGAFAIRNSVFDVYTMGVIGLGAYFLMLARIPVTPVILGLVLGPTLEREFRTAMILSEGKLDIFYTSPAAIIFFALALSIFVLKGIGVYKKKKQDMQPATRGQ
ncbi:MAG: tripartite tricarboxylate transporter permease [Hyphomicrobiales bacterium]